MAHRSDTTHVELADELSAEWRTTGRIEIVEDVEMFLDQLRSRQSAEIENAIIYGVNAIRADRHYDIAVTRQHL